MGHKRLETKATMSIKDESSSGDGWDLSLQTNSFCCANVVFRVRSLVRKVVCITPCKEASSFLRGALDVRCGKRSVEKYLT